MTKTGRTDTRNILILISLTLLTLSCNRGKGYYANEEFPPEGWSKFNRPEFSFEIDDTLSAYDILFSVRSSHNYPYRNLFLFVTTTSPEGISIKDTVEYQLASEKGNWYGKGIGDLYNLSLPYKINVLFPVPGEYRFKIEQGMRTESLEGMVDLGLIIKERDK
jgi:gliding motility-associated lipoprotein GldH